MKKTFIAALIASVSTIATMGVAHAVDGEITFTGEVVPNTCEISRNNFDVPLARVSKTALAEAGAVASSTGFTIALTNCEPKSGKVTAFFEADANVDMDTGRLKNLKEEDPDGAKNVQVELLNEDFQSIKVGAAVDQQNLKYADIDAVTGEAKLQYYAQYYAKAAAESGFVDAKVRYTLTYQ